MHVKAGRGPEPSVAIIDCQSIGKIVFGFRRLIVGISRRAHPGHFVDNRTVRAYYRRRPQDEFLSVAGKGAGLYGVGPVREQTRFDVVNDVAVVHLPGAEIGKARGIRSRTLPTTERVTSGPEPFITVMRPNAFHNVEPSPSKRRSDPRTGIPIIDVDAAQIIPRFQTVTEVSVLSAFANYVAGGRSDMRLLAAITVGGLSGMLQSAAITW